MTGYESKRAAARDKLAQPESTAGYGKKIESLIPERDELRDEIKKLQKALSFWHPGVPANDSECAERCANDAYLLAGYDGDSEPSARELGWIEMVEKQEQPAQEPVAWTLLLVGEHSGIIGKPGEQFLDHSKHYERVDVYTAPPQRTWVGLTDEETLGFTPHEMAVVKYVSKVLKDKNT